MSKKAKAIEDKLSHETSPYDDTPGDLNPQTPVAGAPPASNAYPANVQALPVRPPRVNRNRGAGAAVGNAPDGAAPEEETSFGSGNAQPENIASRPEVAAN